MKPELMEILVCPICRGDLKLDVTKKEGDEIVEGTLTCSNCGDVFPIEESIPNLLPPDLRAS